MRSVGLFGGTFDPVHKGHLQLADAAYHECLLDSVLFIPSASPPHKQIEKISSFKDRFKMLEIATRSDARFSVSDIESMMQKPSYTLDTLNKLGVEKSAENYYFIIGSDAFFEIESWYRWEDVLGLTNFILAVRAGFEKVRIIDFLKRNGFICLDEMNKVWENCRSGTTLMFLEAKVMNISSTDIRKRISERENWKHLVPEEVCDYIMSRSLYL